METKATQSNACVVGKLCREIDAHVEKLAPGCVSNLSVMPDKWPVILRHVTGRARRNEHTAPLIEQLESAEWTPGGSFWLGYYGSD